jgi:hypothetical protein
MPNFQVLLMFLLQRHPSKKDVFLAVSIHEIIVDMGISDMSLYLDMAVHSKIPVHFPFFPRAFHQK